MWAMRLERQILVKMYLTAGFLSSGRIIWFFGFSDSLFQMPPNQPLFEVELQMKERLVGRKSNLLWIMGHFVSVTFGPSPWPVEPISMNYPICQSVYQNHRLKAIRRQHRNWVCSTWSLASKSMV